MNGSDARTTPQLVELAKLGFLVAVSLILTAKTNFWAGKFLTAHLSAYSWLATAAVPSFFVIAASYLHLGERKALRWPPFRQIRESGALRLSAIWLSLWVGGLGLAAVLTDNWVTYAQGTAPLLAFLFFGPAGEELLFRGLVFERVRRIWPTTPAPAILLSTAAFSAHHLWIQAAPDGLLGAQLLFAIPMGFVFATLRERTGSLLPGLLVHIATNLPSAF
jgi:membrane protease YdiL (CAAX protease family)